MSALNARSVFAQQLIDALQGRRSPLPIVLEDHGVIVAKRFDYAGPYSISVTFLHPEGNIVIGSNWPSRAEFMDITKTQLLESSYADLAELVCDNHGYEWKNFKDSPWLDDGNPALRECFDSEGLFLKETPALRARLLEWLIEEDEEAPWIDGLFPELHEGLVGYAVRDALPKAEVTRLGLITGDFRGGPGGYAERVAFKGNPTELEEALRKWRLPFTVFGREEQ
jgi:hypothetical protein